jgi:hypothetical protein
MLIGRWSSDAFLPYIRKQVKQFSQNVAKHMLTFRSFQTIPGIAPQVVSNKDSQKPNHCNNAKTKRNIGQMPGAASGFLPFQLINKQMTHEQLMEGASFLIAKGFGGGES